MILFKKMKDGGPESTVTGYWLIEAKKLLSVVLLKFEGASRRAFHNHAFHSLSWVLRGKLIETSITGDVKVFKPSLLPFITTRSNFHRVDSEGTTYVLTFRGPWTKTWNEFVDNTVLTLTNGRKIIG